MSVCVRNKHGSPLIPCKGLLPEARKLRFNNRASSWKAGRVAPGIPWETDAQMSMMDLMQQRLPENNLNLEPGTYGTPNLQDPGIQGIGYQTGVRSGDPNIKKMFCLETRTGV